MKIIPETRRALYICYLRFHSIETNFQMHKMMSVVCFWTFRIYQKICHDLNALTRLYNIDHYDI